MDEIPRIDADLASGHDVADVTEHAYISEEIFVSLFYSEKIQEHESNGDIGRF